MSAESEQVAIEKAIVEAQHEVEQAWENIGKHRRRIRLLLPVYQYLPVVLLILAGICAYLADKHQYFSYLSDRSGHVQRVSPRINPPTQRAKVVKWSDRALAQIMSTSFEDIDRDVVLWKQFFLPESFDMFVQALNGIGFMKTVKDEGLFLTAFPIEPTAIQRRYERGGVVHWRLRSRLFRATEGASAQPANKIVVVDLVVVEVPKDETIHGLLIKSISPKVQD